MLKDSISFEMMEGGGVIVDLESNVVVRVNSTAAQILQWLVDGKPLDSVSSLMCDRYGLSVEQSQLDLDALIVDLQKAGLWNARTSD